MELNHSDLEPFYASLGRAEVQAQDDFFSTVSDDDLRFIVAEINAERIEEENVARVAQHYKQQASTVTYHCYQPKPKD